MEKMHLKPSVWWKVFEKFRRKTKATVFLCLCTALQSVATNGIAQQKISLNLRQVALKEVFSELRRQTGYVILLSTADVDQYQKVSIQCRERSLTDFLDEFLKKLHLGYKIEEDYISIFKVTPPDTVEEFLIKGKVTDAKGVPLPGVTIVLEGTTVGVASDNDGNFTLNLPQSKGTLVCSFIGYKTVKVSYVAGIPLSIKMEESIAELDEVQVVAYGKQSKREMTGSMSVVDASQIKDIPSVNITNLLQGKVAGMNVVNISGAPGAGGTTVTIRGFNSLSIEATRLYSEPLYVIDGIPVISTPSVITGTSPLADLDPSDIQSVSVLKDAASAAIYGSRASNGVILITTKQGRYNMKPHITANVTHSISFRPEIPLTMGGNTERRYRLEALKNYRQAYYDYETGTYRYASSLEESYYNNVEYNYFWNRGEGRDIAILQDSLNPLYSNCTNWYKYYYRRAHVTDANIQINGGAEKVSYSGGIGYYSELGTIRNTGFKRLKLFTNLSMKPWQNIESNIRIYLAYTNRDRNGEYTGIHNTGEDVSYVEIPTLVRQSTLYPGPGNSLYDEYQNEVGEIKERNATYRARAGFDLAVEFLKGLRLKSTVNADFVLNKRHTFVPSTLDEYDESYSSGQYGVDMVLLNENLLTYKHTFAGHHNLDLLFGLSFESNERNIDRGYGRRGPTDKNHMVNWPENVYDVVAQRVLKDYMSDYEKSTSVGVFGRINYNYKQKYLLSVTLRKDASSKFGEDVRWGIFPSFALAYTFSEEKFMSWARSILDYGKVRVSYGKSGRQFDQPYISAGLLVPGEVFLGNPTVQPQFSEGLMNRKLTWEETKQLDVGFDLDLFMHRFNIVFDYYHRYTDKLLYLINLPGNYNGFTSQWQNAFGIVNQGIELMLKGTVANRDEFNVTLSFNMAKNWNLLKKSYSGRDFVAYRSSDNVNVIGKSLNGILAYDDHGLYKSNKDISYYYNEGIRTPLLGSDGYEFYQEGDRVITDVDKNGRIKVNYPLADDRIYCATPLPKVQGGISADITWKNFDLSFTFAYVLGRHILNKGRYASLATTFGLSADDIIKPIHVNLNEITFWSPDHPDADFPANRMENGLQNFAVNLRSNIEKVSYLKGKTLTLGYTIPQSLQEKLKFKARAFISLENYFNWNNYSGSDPETVPLLTGIDNGTSYPLSLKLIFGLTLNF